MPQYKFPKTIGPKFVNKILPWVETFWHGKKRYPTDDELVQKFGFTPEQLFMLHNSKFYENCLERRGIKRLPGDLTSTQVAAITMITNFSDTRNTEVKMAAIGVDPETLNGWYSEPDFQRELAARADSILDNIFPEAQAQLARQLKNGNFQALKFYYEITGRAQSPEAVNLKMAMNKLVEAVQKHIKDPVILQAIAHEMTGVITPVAALPPQGELSMAERYKEFVEHGN